MPKSYARQKGGKGHFSFICRYGGTDTGYFKPYKSDPHGWAILSRNNAHLDELESLIEQPVIRYGGKSFWDEKKQAMC